MITYFKLPNIVSNLHLPPIELFAGYTSYFLHWLHLAPYLREIAIPLHLEIKKNKK